MISPTVRISPFYRFFGVTLTGRTQSPITPKPYSSPPISWANEVRFASTARKKAAMTLTPAANERFQQLLKRRKFDPRKGAVQLSVEEKGCAGMSYTFNFIQDKEDPQFKTLVKVKQEKSADQEEQEDFVTLLIDRQCISYLLGTEIDWVEGDVSSQFTFNNPNSRKSCSCGKSFAPA